MLNEQTPQMAIQMKTIDAQAALELARVSHEKYLTGFKVSDLNEAVEYYIKALKMDPALSESYYRLACLLWEKGEISIESAIEQCKAAVGLAPTNANAHIYMAYFFKLANETENAEKEFYEAIKLAPLKSGRARLLLSQLLLDKRSNLLQSAPEYVKSVHYFLTGSFMMLCDRASLRMLCSAVKDNFKTMKYKFLGNFYETFKKNTEAIEAYHSGASQTAHPEYFYHTCGDLLIKENEPEAALGAYKEALKLNPRSRELLVKAATVTQTYFEDRCDETIDYYTRLLELEPENAKIYYELGHLYIQKEDRINAVNAFKLALDYDPDNAFYHNSFAFSLVQVEHYDLAIEHYKKAININPENEWTAIVCQALALIYQQIKENPEAALAFYDMAIVLDPKSVEAYLAIGDIHLEEGNLDDAIKAYCDAINVNNQSPKAYAKAGMALWEKDYMEEAIIAYNKAIKLDPDFSLALNNLGVIYLDGIGNVQEALRLFEKAVSIDENYVLANFNLARAYHALGNRTLAAQYYQITIDLNKSTQVLDEHDVQSRLFDLFRV